MPDDELLRPTDAELQILRVLWRDGPSTVRHVHEALIARGTGYTTVLKLMQIMVAKELLQRDTSQRSHVFSPLVSRESTQGRLLDDLLDKAFGGSASSLVARALATRPTSADELAEIRALLDSLEPRADGADERDEESER